MISWIVLIISCVTDIIVTYLFIDILIERRRRRRLEKFARALKDIDMTSENVVIKLKGTAEAVSKAVLVLNKIRMRAIREMDILAENREFLD